jgi:hypothetical protein
MSAPPNVEPLAVGEVSADRLDRITAPFVCLQLPGVSLEPAGASALTGFLLAHPDYAAAGPRLRNRVGDVVTTWTTSTARGLLGRVDRRLSRLASAPLASRDAQVLSCAALVVDTEELLATLVDAEANANGRPLCWRLAERWRDDARRLRWCADVYGTWDTDARVAADLDAGQP